MPILLIHATCTSSTTVVRAGHMLQPIEVVGAGRAFGPCCSLSASPQAEGQLLGLPVSELRARCLHTRNSDEDTNGLGAVEKAGIPAYLQPVDDGRGGAVVGCRDDCLAEARPVDDEVVGDVEIAQAEGLQVGEEVVA